MILFIMFKYERSDTPSDLSSSKNIQAEFLIKYNFAKTESTNPGSIMLKIWTVQKSSDLINLTKWPSAVVGLVLSLLMIKLKTTKSYQILNMQMSILISPNQQLQPI